MGQSAAHPAIPKLERWLARRRIGRRDFLRSVTLLGMPAAAAIALADTIAGRVVGTAEAQEALPQGGTLTIGMPVSEVHAVHAQSRIETAIITMQVLQHLTRTGADNITRPLLLERWEASEDLRTWTLHVRPDVRWRNGRRLVAEDVAWNLNRILDPATGSSTAGLMQGYLLADQDTGQVDEAGNPILAARLWDANAIETVDDKTVRLNLKTPQLAVPEHLFHYPNQMMDPEEGGVFGPGANGTGPFELLDIEVGVRAILKAREDAGRTAHLDRIEFLDTGDDPADALTALQAREVLGLHQVDLSVVPALQETPGVVVHHATTAGTAVVQMRITVRPFNDPLVRLAMRYAIDPQRVLEAALAGFGMAAEHHAVSPIHPDYAPLPRMVRDPAKARALLAEAGYPDGIEVEIHVKQDPPWELAAVLAMQEQYAEAGVVLNIRTLATTVFWEQWKELPLAFVEWAHRPLGVMMLSLGYRSGAPWNPTGFADPDFDRLLDEAEATLDVDARRTVMAELERIMQERGPIVQPCWRGVMTGMDARVKGFRMHPMGFIFGEELALEAE
jgi:peptide/nickel transport system substrate-binding protein